MSESEDRRLAQVRAHLWCENPQLWRRPDGAALVDKIVTATLKAENYAAALNGPVRSIDEIKAELAHALTSEDLGSRPDSAAVAETLLWVLGEGKAPRC